MTENQKQPKQTPSPKPKAKSPATPETETLQPADPQTVVVASGTSSDVQPDWDAIKTPEELLAESEQAEQAAIIETEEAEEQDKFDELAKKGMHLVMTGTMHGANFAMDMKGGGKLDSLDPSKYEPGLKEAHDCMVDIMELDPEGFFGKVLAFCGGIDERWMPIFIAYGAITANVKKELSIRAKELAEKKANETPDNPTGEPMPSSPPPAPTESSEPKPIAVSQP